MNSALPVEQTENQFTKQTKTKKQNSSCVSPTMSSGSVSLGSSGSDSGAAAELVSTAAADEGAVTSCKLSHWEKMVKKCWTCSEKVIFWLFRFWSLCSHYEELNYDIWADKNPKKVHQVLSVSGDLHSVHEAKTELFDWNHKNCQESWLFMIIKKQRSYISD